MRRIQSIRSWPAVHVAVALAAACAGGGAWSRAAAQDAPSAGRKIVTMTRWMAVFSDLEGRLAAALAAGDQAAASALLTDDFELRTSDRIGEPVPRAEWLARELGHGPGELALDEMAARDLGEVVIVSFRAHSVAHVDVWRRVDGQWKLAARYATPPKGSGRAAPGSAGERRPDGKG